MLACERPNMLQAKQWLHYYLYREGRIGADYNSEES